MSTLQTFISGDRECDQCGYNLHGLPENGKCPECGISIRKKLVRTTGTMSDEAPTRFVRHLRIGFALASMGIIGTIISSFAGPFLRFPSALLWVLGIWMTTAQRPGRAKIMPDKVLDNDRFRLLVRLVSVAWPIYSLLLLAFHLLTLSATPTAPPPSSLLTIPLSILLVCSGIVSWIGLVPTCIYFAELSYWSSHDHLANRLRSSAWAMSVFGTIGVLFLGVAALGIGPSAAAGVLSGIMFVLVTIAAVIFLFTIFQLGSVMSWVIRHQQMAAGSADRVRERIEREISSPGKIITGLICRSCKYDLEGLPFGGRCPECGESYADYTPSPIIDPALMHQSRDESEIIIEDGENKGIYFNTELDAYGKPRSDGIAYVPDENVVPLDGDIPLSIDHSPESSLEDIPLADESKKDDPDHPTLLE